MNYDEYENVAYEDWLQEMYDERCQAQLEFLYEEACHAIDEHRF